MLVADDGWDIMVAGVHESVSHHHHFIVCLLGEAWRPVYSEICSDRR